MRVPAAVAALYFGYGSNLWLEQMSLRCPNSTFVGRGRLDGYSWIIKEPGYANVVQIDTQQEKDNGPNTVSTRGRGIQSVINDLEAPDYNSQVWGLLYTLTPEDEARLDRNEGVPYSYTKEYLPVSVWNRSVNDTHSTMISSKPMSANGPPNETDRQVLVYIDRKRTTPTTPKLEYIDRMNHGIEDALRLGVPSRYIEGVLRKYIPAPAVLSIGT